MYPFPLTRNSRYGPAERDMTAEVLDEGPVFPLHEYECGAYLTKEFGCSGRQAILPEEFRINSLFVRRHNVGDTARNDRLGKVAFRYEMKTARSEMLRDRIYGRQRQDKVAESAMMPYEYVFQGDGLILRKA